MYSPLVLSFIPQSPSHPSYLPLHLPAPLLNLNLDLCNTSNLARAISLRYLARTNQKKPDEVEKREEARRQSARKNRLALGLAFTALLGFILYKNINKSPSSSPASATVAATASGVAGTATATANSAGKQ